MARSRSQKGDRPRFIGELTEWFDNHDTGDYLAQMPEVDFEIDIKRHKHLVALDPDLAARVNTVARAKKVSSESLIKLVGKREDLAAQNCFEVAQFASLTATSRLFVIEPRLLQDLQA